jgi:hypothetical protein
MRIATPFRAHKIRLTEALCKARSLRRAGGRVMTSVFPKFRIVGDTCGFTPQLALN